MSELEESGIEGSVLRSNRKVPDRNKLFAAYVYISNHPVFEVWVQPGQREAFDEGLNLIIEEEIERRGLI